VLRAATSADVDAIYALISTHLREGHLLPRSIEDIDAHVARFIVATIGDRIVACADLAPLSPLVAEVRSLVVDASARSKGLGQRIVSELAQRARVAGFDSLCAFTHSAGYFVRLGFTIVPHPWIPEKIEADCRTCPLFRHCGQYAVTLPLAHGVESFVPLASLHG
jgi:N-acetylglutamate synthase-like GNAT family acetyltransferase